MERFQWTAGYAVFQAECDSEHRDLFGLGEEVHCALQAGADAQTVAQATSRLAAGMEAHFAHEERLMRAARYAGYAWHKRQHDSARRRIASLSATPEELLNYLTGWFRDHTGVADRMMAAALRNAGRRRQVFTAT
jgi:hemerythrin